MRKLAMRLWCLLIIGIMGVSCDYDTIKKQYEKDTQTQRFSGHEETVSPGDKGDGDGTTDQEDDS